MRLWNYFIHIAENRLLEYSVEEYKKNRYIKTFLFREEPVDLLDVYVPNDFRTSNKTLLQLFKEEFKIRPAALILSTSSLYGNIIITGGPGYGKSTYLQYLYVTLIDSKKATPLKVDLRNFNSYKGSFFEFIDGMFRFQNLVLAENLIDTFLERGDIVFLFDGYDELEVSRRPEFLRAITDFTTRYSKNSYFITSRPNTNLDSLEGFSTVAIQKFDKEKIKLFVEKQCSVKIASSFKDKKGELLKFISKEYKHNTNLIDFLTNPLLLSMFIMMYDYNKLIPLKKADFYQQAYETLAYRHDMRKKELDRKWVSQLTRDQMLQFLCSFSSQTFFKGLLNFSLSTLKEEIRPIRDAANLTVDIDHLISDLLVSLGILINEGDKYFFSHKSFQEYFTALNISRLQPEKKNIFYKKLLHDDSYQLYFFNYYTIIHILSELNYDEFVLYYASPLLKKCISHINSCSTQEAWSTVTILVKTINVLLNAAVLHRDMIKELFEPEKSSFEKMYTVDENGNFRKMLHESGDAEFVNFRNKLILNGYVLCETMDLSAKRNLDLNSSFMEFVN